MTEEDNLDEDMYSEDIEFTPADDSVENVEQELEKDEVYLEDSNKAEKTDPQNVSFSADITENSIAEEIKPEEVHFESVVGEIDELEDIDNVEEPITNAPNFTSEDEVMIGIEDTNIGDISEPDKEYTSINLLEDSSTDNRDKTDLFSTTENYVVDEETSSPQFTSELEEKDIESMVIPQMGLAQTAKIAADAAALEVQPPDGSGKIVQRTDGELQQAAANLAGYQPETEKLPANSDGLGATPRPSQALNRIKTLAGELKNTRFGFG
jgi:hypothetical protein